MLPSRIQGISELCPMNNPAQMPQKAAVHQGQMISVLAVQTGRSQPWGESMVRRGQREW